jgi:amino-acid N-acetyltransferase
MVRQPGMQDGSITVRAGRPTDAPEIHSLIEAHLREGHLLPRTMSDLHAHATRFVVARQGRRLVGCAELAPLSRSVAEVRSLAVDSCSRGVGLGGRLVAELRHRAQRDGFGRLCVFTHVPNYFIRLGFAIVPHMSVPEKAQNICPMCPLFARCGQHAMMLPLNIHRGGADPEQRL